MKPNNNMRLSGKLFKTQFDALIGLYFVAKNYIYLIYLGEYNEAK